MSVTRHNMTSLRVQKKAWSDYKGRHLIIIETYQYFMSELEQFKGCAVHLTICKKFKLTKISRGW